MLVNGREVMLDQVCPLFYSTIFMSLFTLPKGVADKLVRIQKNFLWGWGAEEGKLLGPLGVWCVSLVILGD